MPRQITSHMVNGCNEALTISVTDEPGAGGACHRYEIAGANLASNASAYGPTGVLLGTGPGVILFQNGPIPEKGTNGFTHEALLAIIADRLSCFQAGPYACEENGTALDAVNAAITALQLRTLKRMARNVEGTMAK